MSIKGFVRRLRTATSTPDYVRNMTPEQRAERLRQDANRNMFAIQMFDMPKPRPYKAPRQPDRHDSEPPAKR